MTGKLAPRDAIISTTATIRKRGDRATRAVDNLSESEMKAIRAGRMVLIHHGRGLKRAALVNGKIVSRDYFGRLRTIKQMVLFKALLKRTH